MIAEKRKLIFPFLSQVCVLAASTSAMADRHVVFMYVWKCLTARLWTHYGKGGWRQAFVLHDVYIVL
jgi:hypothetical protein